MNMEALDDDDGDNGDDDVDGDVKGDEGKKASLYNNLIRGIKFPLTWLHCITLQGIGFPKPRVLIETSDNREV